MLVILCSAQRGQTITKLEAEVTQLKKDLVLSQQNAQAAGKQVMSTTLSTTFVSSIAHAYASPLQTQAGI